MPDSPYESFLKPANFVLAYTQLVAASPGVYKDLYRDDLRVFNLSLERNVGFLIEEIRKKIYQPSKSLKIFAPKKSGLVRPLSLLRFSDLLVYQAMMIVLAEHTKKDLQPYNNSTIFGSIHNPQPNSPFFFLPWKGQWKNFQKKTRENFEKNYVFISEFDIASFFDTIDHEILQRILHDKYSIDDDFCNLLIQCLSIWTVDEGRKNYKCSHGIPQGPSCSHFLANLFLLEVDKAFKDTNLDAKYIRYVDDIRVFSRDELTAKKSVALLDLLARDYGLIPQATKIAYRRIDDINTEIRDQSNNLSEFFNNDGLTKSLSPSKHDRLKQRFKDCFIKDHNDYLNKTVIRSALYRLNADEEVMQMILDNYAILDVYIDDWLFYLSKYYADNALVLKCLSSILSGENQLFRYCNAMILKYFPNIPFNHSIYRKYSIDEGHNWLVKYYMYRWLFQNNETELLNALDSANYFLRRERHKFIKACKSKNYVLERIREFLSDNEDPMLSLHGLDAYYEIFKNFNIKDAFIERVDHFSHRAQSCIDGINLHYAIFSIERTHKIQPRSKIFHVDFWTGYSDDYEALNANLFLYDRYCKGDYINAVILLNSFNHVLVKHLYRKLNLDLPEGEEYAQMLSKSEFKKLFPIACNRFSIVNENRNRKTYAHPYDNKGIVSRLLNYKEFQDIQRYEKEALRELSRHFCFS